MPREPIIYVNREFVPQSQARISVLDHAVLYGDGIFETAVARNGLIFKLDAHIERGFRSMAAIALAPPCDRARMREFIIETVRRNGLKDAYIKWLVTRGSNGRPLMDPAGCEPNLIILALPYIDRVMTSCSALRERRCSSSARNRGSRSRRPTWNSTTLIRPMRCSLPARRADCCRSPQSIGRVIGSSRPGPTFRALRMAYEQLIASEKYGKPVLT